MTTKVAFVTGASRGIGRAIARAAATAGAQVVLASRKQEDLDRVAEEIRGEGGTALAVACHTGKGEDEGCMSCHRFETTAGVEQVAIATETCATCHNNDDAGAACLLCHTYHQQSPGVLVRRTE